MAAARTDEADWAVATELCIHCGQGDWQEEGFGPRTMLICTACQARGSHVECESAARGEPVLPAEVTAATWFCSEACAQVHEREAGLLGPRLPLAGSQLSLQFVRHDPQDKGAVQGVEAAIRLLERSFDAGELLRRVCTSASGEGEDEDEDDEPYDYSGFLLALLRQGPTLVCAGALRVWGPRFAELPFVATREGYRRCGHLRRLLGAVESALRFLGVRVLVAPCLASLLPMWTRRFGFRLASAAEREALQSQILTMEFDTCLLMHKAICEPQPPPQEQPQPREQQLQERGEPQPRSPPQLQPKPQSASPRPGSGLNVATRRSRQAAEVTQRPVAAPAREAARSARASGAAPESPGQAAGTADAGEAAPKRKARPKRGRDAGAAPRAKRQRVRPGRQAQQAAAGQGQAPQLPPQQPAGAYQQLYRRWQGGLGAGAAAPLLQSAVQMRRGDALVVELLRAAAAQAASRQAAAAQLQLQTQLLRTQEELGAARCALAASEAENARLRAALQRAEAGAAQPEQQLPAVAAEPPAAIEPAVAAPTTAECRRSSPPPPAAKTTGARSVALGSPPPRSLSPAAPASVPSVSASSGRAPPQPALGRGAAARTAGLSALVAKCMQRRAASSVRASRPAAQPSDRREAAPPAVRQAASQQAVSQEAGSQEEQDEAMAVAAQFAWP